MPAVTQRRRRGGGFSHPGGGGCASCPCGCWPEGGPCVSPVPFFGGVSLSCPCGSGVIAPRVSLCPEGPRTPGDHVPVPTSLSVPDVPLPRLSRGLGGPQPPPHLGCVPPQQGQGPGVRRRAGHRLPKRGRRHQLRRADHGRVLHPPRGQVRGAPHGWVAGGPLPTAVSPPHRRVPSVPAGRPALTTPARRSPSRCLRSRMTSLGSRTRSPKVGGTPCRFVEGGGGRGSGC